MIRSQRLLKLIAVFFLQLIVWEVCFPVTAYALTGGPSQPEVESFEPVNTTEMVDPFSGDFVYNIPLMDVEGMPVNMAYHSGITMDQEASWVGLGWNINPGAITRQMRGLPDDFNGDPVKREMNIKENVSYGLRLATNYEFFGYKALGEIDKSLGNLQAGLGVTYNNYQGLGFELNLGYSANIKVSESGSLVAGLGVGAKSYEAAGIDVRASIEERKKYKNDVLENPFRRSIGIGAHMSGMDGLNEIGITTTVPISKKNKNSKRERAGQITNSTMGVSFGFPTFVPKVNNEYVNYAANLTVGGGTEIFGASATPSATGSFSMQDLKWKQRSEKAYGYAYSHEARNGGERAFIMDFNRVNDGVYIKERKKMPLANFTYDLFSIAGEGTGGTFRTSRSDVGVVYDAEAENNTVGLGIGVWGDVGNLAKASLDLSGSYGYSRTDRWKGDDGLDFNVIGRLDFKEHVEDSVRAYEPYYFRNTSESNIVDQDYYNRMGDADPVRIKIEGNRLNTRGDLKDKLETGSTAVNVATGVYRQKRDKRNMAIQALTSAEAQYASLDKSIRHYANNSFVIDSTNKMVAAATFNRRTSAEDKSRFSDFIVTNPDGRRYVYGLPAMNNTQREAVFNVVNPNNLNDNEVDRSLGLTGYSSTANTLANTNGEDNFFQRTTLPAYAHSYMLTAILSPDYVDVTGDGISDDDLGTAVKLNYTRAYANYKWRVPYSRDGNQAYYDEGFKNDRYDDKGSYTYGEKEVWYLHSIESKNYVACFYTSKRDDAKAVKGENGVIDYDSAFYKLDSIGLFTRLDLKQNAGNALPIKTVHFEYDYSLCPKVDNQSNPALGKLTLKKVWFSYGRSLRGSMSPYQFTYSSFNPDYTIKGYDRWGYYKPTPSDADIVDIDDANKGLATHDNPYVTQDKDSADQYMQAWTLTQIQLPSGGKIQLEYESDDYAFVQDREAMQMFPVIGASKSSTFSSGNILYDVHDGADVDNGGVYQYMFFDLPKAIPTSTSAPVLEQLKKNYFPSIGSEVYFKFLVNLKLETSGSNELDYEFISGVAEISDCGFQSKVGGSANYDVGYIKFVKMGVKDKDEDADDSQSDNVVHPVSKLAWNALRMQQPKQVQGLFGKYEPAPVGEKGQLKRAFKSLMGSLAQVRLMFRDFNKVMKHKAVARQFVTNKSFIRLKSPEGKKLGGGSRVKKVTINDNWDNMVSGAESATYGQEFFYEKSDTTNGVIRNISSGVAAYEPQIGREENPFYSVSRYSQMKIMAPDARYIAEEPDMECFYPAPNVGYSYVTTRNYKPAVNIKRTATGYTVNEYYTAYDFPVVEKSTDKFARPYSVGMKVIGKLFGVALTDKVFVSQGYSIELNDMHGRPKAQWSFQEDNPMPVSGVEYRYKYHQDPGSNRRILTDTVNVLKNTGAIEQAYMGKQMDMVVDLRHSESFQVESQGQSNLDAFFATIFPAAVFSLIPNISTEKTEFGSAVTTKVVYRFGILDETIVHDQAASVSTKNLLFDGETGEVLLTQTTNEFNQPLYSFSYPAHFVSNGMGPAYQNLGMQFNRVWFENGVLKGISDYNSFIVPGDELVLFKTTISRDTVFGIPLKTEDDAMADAKMWAVTSPNDPDDVVFMSRSGHLVDIIQPDNENEFYTLKVIRSGRRNMQSVSAGSMVMMSNPAATSTIALTSNIVQSSAVEFDDQWTASYRPVAMEVVNPRNNYGSGKICDQECYLQLINLLTDTGTHPNLIALGVGETIDLREEPFKSLYECVSGSIGLPCANLSSPIIQRMPLSTATKYYAPYTGEEVLYASLRSTPHIAEITRTASVAIDPCDPLSGDTQSMSISQFQIGGCVLTMWKSEHICNCHPESPNQFIACENSTKITQCGSNYLTERFTHPGGCNAFATRICTKIECNDWCATCDTIPAEMPDTGTCLPIEKKVFVNPYIQGIKGNYRPKKNWLFHDSRTGSLTATDTRRHGVYSNYSTFWVKPGTGTLWTPATSKGSWTSNVMVTRINRTGNEIENVNALNIYSAALFGYGQSTAKAVGNNMKYRQMAYDGMEDHSYTENIFEDHFSFRAWTKSGVAHTGLKSVQVNSGNSALVTRPLRYTEIVTPHTNDPGDNHYYRQPLDEQGAFSPDSGRYMLSSWIKEASTTPQANYTADSIAIIIKKMQSISLASPGDYDTTFTDVISYIRPSGPMIEGWQKIEGQFSIPDSAVCITVKLIAGSNNCYFDDIRIHPQQGNMKSFVYHPTTMRLMAELDENNYATFYEYDDEGRLIRIKRETERGIMTIQESRTGLRKTN